MQSNPKYSLLEIEKKWIIDKDNLPDISTLQLIEVTDKYFPVTRIRLRKMFYNESNETKYKLTKKYGKISTQSEPLTTLYLSEFEYNLFNLLEGFVLIKNIYQYPFSGKIFLIELFKIPAVNFILLEAEASSEEEIDSQKIPGFVIKEVTNEKEYEGYEIASRGAIFK